MDGNSTPVDAIKPTPSVRDNPLNPRGSNPVEFPNPRIYPFKPREMFIKKEVAEQAPRDEYRFRPLTEPERTFFSDPNKLANEPERTREILQNEALRPTGIIKVDGREFFVGKIIESWPRAQAVFYTRDQEGKLVPRIFYKSHSDGGWRATRGINKRGRIDKGNDIHYTQETQPHPNIERYLEEAEFHNHKVNNLAFSPIQKYFTLENLPDEMKSYEKEVSAYNDNKALEQPQAFQAGEYTKEDQKQLLQRYPNYNFSKEFGNFDWNRPGLEGFLPDFSKPPINSTSSNHTLLGRIRVDTYAATLQGRPIRWSMAHDASGRVWVEGIAFADSPITTYGTNAEIIDSGALTNKPLEYYSQISALQRGRDFTDFGDEYADITPLLDNLKPIKDYRKYTGVVRNITESNRMAA